MGGRTKTNSINIIPYVKEASKEYARTQTERGIDRGDFIWSEVPWREVPWHEVPWGNVQWKDIPSNTSSPIETKLEGKQPLGNFIHIRNDGFIRNKVNGNVFYANTNSLERVRELAKSSIEDLLRTGEGVEVLTKLDLSGF